MRKRVQRLALLAPLSLLVLVALYYLPPIHSRLGWRVAEARARVKYALNPPEEALFIPGEAAAEAALPTPGVLVLTATPTATHPFTPTATDPGPTPTAEPSPTPTITPTPLPERVFIEGVKYEDQHGRWNYCGPANLSMALTYWGWDGNRDVVGKQLKPSDKDKNIMPYEMQDFVADYTEGLATELRLGGDIEVLKRLVAGGFPVVAEKGYYEVDYTGKLGWLGHYQFVTGYDESKGVLIVQDTYIPDGKNHEFSYADFIEGWRSFNYLFIVVYPVERAAEVNAALGAYADAGLGCPARPGDRQERDRDLERHRQLFCLFQRRLQSRGLAGIRRRHLCL